MWNLEKAGYNPCKRSCLLFFCVYNVQSSILAIVACTGGEIWWPEGEERICMLGIFSGTASVGCYLWIVLYCCCMALPPVQEVPYVGSKVTGACRASFSTYECSEGSFSPSGGRHYVCFPWCVSQNSSWTNLERVMSSLIVLINIDRSNSPRAAGSRVYTSIFS